MLLSFMPRFFGPKTVEEKPQAAPGAPSLDGILPYGDGTVCMADTQDDPDFTSWDFRRVPYGLS